MLQTSVGNSPMSPINQSSFAGPINRQELNAKEDVAVAVEYRIRRGGRLDRLVGSRPKKACVFSWIEKSFGHVHSLCLP